MGLTTKEISSSSFNDMISSVDRRSEYVENRAGANVRLNNFLTPYTLDDKSSILNAPCGYSNGVYASLRPLYSEEEKFSNSFDTLETGWSYNNNILTGVNTPNNAITNVNISISTKFKVSFKINNLTGILFFKVNNTSLSNTITLVADGVYEYIGTVTGASPKVVFDGASSSPFSGTITDISLKQLTDADFDFTRGSAATRVTKDGLVKNVQILSDELVQNGNFEEIGPEEVTNGDFATDSDWVKGTGWSISGGAAVAVAGTSSKLEQQISGLNGKTCKVSLTLSNYGGSGSMYVDFGNVNSSLINTNGEHILYGTFSQNELELFKGGAFSGSIDNVSVKEVGQNWTFGTGWSIENNKLISDGSNTGFSDVRQNNITVSGNKYQLTLVIEAVNGPIELKGSNVYQRIDTLGVGTHTLTFVADATYFRFLALPGSTITIDNVSVIEITDDTDLPRIDYTDGTGSLLLEPQSTNTATYSNDFTQGDLFNQSADPSLSFSVLTQNQETAPDGTNNGWLLKDNNNSGTGATGLNYFSTQVNSDDFNTISIFAKKALSNDFLILETSGYDVDADGRNYFNISNGSLGNISTNHTAKIEDYGNGWYRCSITFQATTDLQGAIYVRLASSNGLVNITRDGTNGVYLFGLQCEADATQNYATSYIPTSGSTVTRNADVCNNAGSSDLINSTEGVLYAEINQDNNFFNTISVSDGTTSNRVTLAYSSDTIRAIVMYGGVVGNIFTSNNTQGEFHKVCIRYNSSNFSLFINGALDSTISKGLFTSNLNTLQFAQGNGGNNFYGNVRSVAVFKEALTDEELAKITSTTQQEAFYEMRDKMLQINADYYEFGDYTTRLKKLF